MFIIPGEGGTPRRLTHTATLSRDDIGDRMGPNNIVLTWTPDGKNIVYRSRRTSISDFLGQLFMVPVEGGMSKEIPLTKSGFCSFSPDGKKLAFNWVFREFRTWKYYEGGMADDIRIFDFDSGKVEKINDTKAQEIFPMWIGNEIFFLSDRDRIMNLFVYNTVTRNTEKVTNFDTYDIKFPSCNNDQIVFENGGYIYKMDAKTRKPEKVTIYIADDFESPKKVMKDASERITMVSPSPDGERVIISARGDIYNVPVKEGVTKNITSTSGVHERNARWSPDGKYIAWISDASGEFEIWMQKADRSQPAVSITRDQNTYIFNIIWSPDSKKILYATKKNDLRFVDIATGKITIVDKSPKSPYFDESWSPDSRWIAFVRDEAGFPVIRIYNLETAKSAEVTNKWYYSADPVFSEDGKYLFFTSERDFNPVYSETEWNHAYVDMSRIYLVPLAKDTPSPFAASDDKVKDSEAEVKAEVKSSPAATAKGKSKKISEVENRKVN